MPPPKFGWAGAYREYLARAASGVFRQPVSLAMRGPEPDAIAQRVQQIRDEEGVEDGWCGWWAVERVTDNPMTPGPQLIGDCVSWGAAHVIHNLICTEILHDGDLERYRQPSTMFLYGTGRVLVGQNRIRGDGSLGEWQIEAAQKYGVLATDEPGFPGYNSSQARSFGSKRSTLEPWLPKAAPFPIGAATEISDADELVEVLGQSRKPCTIASNWGFAPDKFDSARGIWLYKSSGRWAHQMAVTACIKLAGEWFAFVQNSWGKSAHKTNDKHRPDVGPGSGFWIPLDLFGRWIKDSGCFCTSYELFSGWPEPKPDFNIL